ATMANPMDVTAEAVARPELLSQAADVILKDDAVGNLVMFFGIVPGAHEKLAAAIARVAQGTDKLVVMTWFPLPRSDIWMNLARAGVPVFSEPARGIRALGKMTQYMAARERLPALTARPAVTMPAHDVENILAQARNQGRKALSEIDAKSLLKSCGLAVPRGGLSVNSAEARSLARDIGGAVALKASSPDLMHKTEAGVIRLNLSNPEDVEKAFNEIVTQARKWNPEARLDGVLVEEMIGGESRELIVGARQDLRFGPVVTFGLGGIFVEAIRDFAVWPAPLTLEEAREMIRKIRGYRILTAFRGRPAADLESVARTICQVGLIASQWREQIAELEINPLFVLPEESGVIVGDALAALK
ncbi:MAG: acetate--CoA ligase family protein, partial [Deltaproteobacteria bacterium]|nr:acetate--CoA ligase family protein [Deltaproteobacteria bacterium]